MLRNLVATAVVFLGVGTAIQAQNGAPYGTSGLPPRSPADPGYRYPTEPRYGAAPAYGQPAASQGAYAPGGYPQGNNAQPTTGQASSYPSNIPPGARDYRTADARSALVPGGPVAHGPSLGAPQTDYRNQPVSQAPLASQPRYGQPQAAAVQTTAAAEGESVPWPGPEDRGALPGQTTVSSPGAATASSPVRGGPPAGVAAMSGAMPVVVNGNSPATAVGAATGSSANRGMMINPALSGESYSPAVGNPVTPSGLMQAITGGTPAVSAATAAGSATTAATEGSTAEPVVNAQWKQISDDIHKQLEQLKTAEGLDEAVKTKLTEQLNVALERLQSADKAAKKSAQHLADIEGAPANVAASKEQLSQPAAENVLLLAPEITVTQLEQQLAEWEQKLTEAKEQQKQTSERADTKVRSDRKAEIAKSKDAVQKQLLEVEKDSKTAVPDESPLAAACRKLSLQARRAEMEAQLAAFDAESRRDDAYNELFPLQRDLAKRQVNVLEKAVDRWKAAISDQRKLETERQAAEARRKLESAHPALRSVAERNASLTEQRSELTSLMESAAAALKESETSAKALQEDFDRVKRKVEASRMSSAAGLLLRNRRDHLPVPRVYEERIAFCSTEMQRVQMALVELEEERENLGDLDAQEEEVIRDLHGAMNSIAAAQAQGMVRELLQNRQKYLDDLLNDFKSYHDDLSDLELAGQQLLKCRQEYEQYIDERVLWIRSERPLQVSDVSESMHGLGVLFNGAQWKAVAVSLGRGLIRQPLICLLAVAVFALLFISRQRLRNRLEAIGERHQAIASSLLPTFEAVILTLMIVAVWPSVLWFIGWLLARAGDSSDLSYSLSCGFQSTSLLFWTLETIRQTCRRYGLGEQHFGWNAENLRRVHHSMVGLMTCALPATFLVTVAEAMQDGVCRVSLARLIFLTALFVIAGLLHFVLKPTGGVVHKILENRTTRWLSPLRYGAYAIGVGTPLVLAGLSACGYSFTAKQLLNRSWNTLGVVLAAVLLHALLSRGVDMIRRKLASFRHTTNLKDPDAREVATAAQDAGKHLTGLLRGAMWVGLLIGCGYIWSDVVPALNVLDRVELWHTTVTAYETMPDVDGGSITREVTKAKPITLANLLFCGLVLSGSLFAARTIPSLLVATLLRRLPIDHGGQHAIALIGRYLITLLGMMLGCSLIGITWSSLQWLAAAMTVGLGFGMQEIFANFVSGLIILFERPVRVGDLVTVNGTTGTVTRMRIRATTITDPDRRELIVPNKTFITQDVVNWTLSDTVSRFVVSVGIGYESDSTKARDILLRVAQSHPLILREPAPTALMVGFGDSTKNFELRAFMGSRDKFAVLLHEIHVAIEKAFREEGIEIAYPQQDIRIRSMEGLAEALAVQRANPRHHRVGQVYKKAG